MEPSGDVFTRGGPGMADTRGASMVAKHADKLARDREERATQRLQLLVPQLGAAARAAALRESGWDEDAAAALLRRFQAAKAAELGALRKERRRRGAAARGGEEGSATSSSTSGSDSGDERRRGRRRRREPRSKKRAKRSRSPRGRGGDRYGRYGVIRESDLQAKRAEFELWLAEARRVDAGSLPRAEERALFAQFVEDYNTATLPHRKFYDLEAHWRREAAREARRAARGEAAPQAEEKSAFDDEAERRREAAAERARRQGDRLRAAYDELRTTDKAEEMRQQEVLKARLSLAYRTGDRQQAQRLAERLRPDDKAPGAPPPREPKAGT